MEGGEGWGGGVKGKKRVACKEATLKRTAIGPHRCRIANNASRLQDVLIGSTLLIAITVFIYTNAQCITQRL